MTEYFENLPPSKADRFDTLWDSAPSPRKFTQPLRTKVTPEMYALAQFLWGHPKLPFNGSESAFLRHCVAAGIESLKEYLDSDHRSMYNLMREAQLRWTNERYILTIDQQLNTAAEILQTWSESQEWDAVIGDLRYAVENIKAYPVQIWRVRAARAWLRHEGIRALRRRWEVLMHEDSPAKWQEVRELFEELLLMSRLV